MLDKLDIPDLFQSALLAAQGSPDPSTQNGALLYCQDDHDGIRLTDCNRFPDGVQYLAARWERPGKYRYIEHAERNVIFSAARHGIKTQDSVMVCPWAACSDCARAIVQAGVRFLIRLPQQNDMTHDRWTEECAVGDIILREGNVFILEASSDDLAGKISCPELRRNGKITTFPYV